MLLYFRMIFMTIVGLFTTRVILIALGVSDLGLLNVAGSVVGMFTFLNGTLSSGTQRFLTYGLGASNKEKLKKTFASAMTLHLILAIILVVLCETIGLWYLYNKLVVAPERFRAAIWCYQLSVIGTAIGIIQVPFNSALVAHEKMEMYAYISIYDAVFKLLAAYLIQIVSLDRVIFFSSLSLGVNLGSTLLYYWYCQRHFEECSFHLGYDKRIFCEMLSFSGWNIIGSLAFMGQGTGVNLVLNSFYGTVVNGARGIAIQANNWVFKFVESFMVAIRPQITKSYAMHNYKRMADLVCNGSCYGSYLYLFLGIPLFIEIEWVLGLWLGKCPQHTAAFLRILMVQLLFQTIGHLTGIAMHATGKLKNVNLTVAVILLTIVPMSYILSDMGYSSEVVLAANVIPWVIVPFVRIIWVNKYSGGNFPIRRYIIQVFIKTILLAFIMFIPPYIVWFLTEKVNDFFQFLIVGTTSVVTSALIIFYWGFNGKTRKKVLMNIKNIMREKFLSKKNH